MEELTIPNGVTSIGNYAFTNCSSLTSIVIPNSVTTIGTRAFDTCTGLTSVTIGSGVKTIENYAFDRCSGLESITCYATTAPTIYSSTFNRVNKNGTLYYPEGSDYSTWLKNYSYYLGYYGWTGSTI